MSDGHDISQQFMSAGAVESQSSSNKGKGLLKLLFGANGAQRDRRATAHECVMRQPSASNIPVQNQRESGIALPPALPPKDGAFPDRFNSMREESNVSPHQERKKRKTVLSATGMDQPESVLLPLDRRSIISVPSTYVSLKESERKKPTLDEIDAMLPGPPKTPPPATLNTPVDQVPKAKILTPAIMESSGNNEEQKTKKYRKSKFPEELMNAKSGDRSSFVFIDADLLKVIQKLGSDDEKNVRLPEVNAEPPPLPARPSDESPSRSMDIRPFSHNSPSLIVNGGSLKKANKKKNMRVKFSGYDEVIAHEEVGSDSELSSTLYSPMQVADTAPTNLIPSASPTFNPNQAQSKVDQLGPRADFEMADQLDVPAAVSIRPSSIAEKRDSRLLDEELSGKLRELKNLNDSLPGRQFSPQQHAPRNPSPLKQAIRRTLTHQEPRTFEEVPELPPRPQSMRIDELPTNVTANLSAPSIAPLPLLPEDPVLSESSSRDASPKIQLLDKPAILSSTSISTPTSGVSKKKVKRRHIQIQARPVEFKTVAIQCFIVEDNSSSAESVVSSTITSSTAAVASHSPIRSPFDMMTQELDEELKSLSLSRTQSASGEVQEENDRLRAQVEELQARLTAADERYQLMTEQAYMGLQKLMEEKQAMAEELDSIRGFDPTSTMTAVNSETQDEFSLT
jgi:hypothetical protein